MIKRNTYNYFDYSKNILVGIIFILPFLFVYEIICLIYFKYSEYEIRNTADIILHDIFNIFGDYSQIFYSLSLLFIVAILYFVNIKKNRKFKIITLPLFLIALEGLMYGFILTLILNDSNIFNLEGLYQSDLLLNLYLCIGAGIWEEILFRLLIFNLFIFIMFKTFKNSTIFNVLISIVLCSFFFSLFHYIGVNGDIFNFNSFFLRFVGGLYLTILYHFRGFGVTAMAHLSYDFILVSLPLI